MILKKKNLAIAIAMTLTSANDGFAQTDEINVSEDVKKSAEVVNEVESDDEEAGALLESEQAKQSSAGRIRGLGLPTAIAIGVVGGALIAGGGSSDRPAGPLQPALAQ